MLHSPLPSDLASKVKQLERDRQRHAQAIAVINQALQQIAHALTSLRQGKHPQASHADFTPEQPTALDETIAAAAPPAYGGYFKTGEQAILDLVNDQGSATTAEINRHWRAQGRRGAANNAIGRLLKRGLLHRQPIGGQRGSRYFLTDRATSESPRDALTTPSM